MEQLPEVRNRPVMYFTQDTENAVVEYNNESVQMRRNEIYRSLLEKPFHKLAENVINTFKFSYFDDTFDNIRDEVVHFMVEKISQYDQSKGKAFSYFSIVAKNYLILINNTNYKRFKIHDEVDVLDLNRNLHSELRLGEKRQEDKEFIRLIIEYWENNIPSYFKKERDIKIANAVIQLFRDIDGIESFNKKALYLLVREMTDCKTQQITKVVNVMRKCYDDIASEYYTKGNINTDNINSNRFF